MKTLGWFGLLLLQEANLLLLALWSCSVTFTLHSLFPVTMNRAVLSVAFCTEQHCRTVGDGIRIVHEIRCIQLLVNMFNVGHKNVIYCIKLFCIVLAVVNGYVAIAHGGENKIFGLLTFCMLCDTMILYPLVYQKAFAIPVGVDRLKGDLRMKMRMCAGNAGMGARAVEMQVRSIPSVGLRVGDFHVLERLSTPIFIDYVIRNIVNLLVMT